MRVLRFGDGGGVVTEPDEQQRERVRRPIVLRIRALPHLERFARLQLIAGHAVVVLVGDEQPLALADAVAVLVGEPRVLFAASGFAEAAVDARQRRVRERELRIDGDGALEQLDGRNLCARGAPLRHRLRVRLQRLERRRRRFLDRHVVARQRGARFAERPADRRTVSCAERAQDVFLALHLDVLLRDRRVGVAVGRGERDDRRAADRRRRCLRASPAARAAGTAPRRRRASAARPACAPSAAACCGSARPIRGRDTATARDRPRSPCRSVPSKSGSPVPLAMSPTRIALRSTTGVHRQRANPIMARTAIATTAPRCRPRSPALVRHHEPELARASIVRRARRRSSTSSEAR